MLTANHISVGIGGKAIVSDVSLTAGEGEWWMLLGPNGAGKTTLLRALSCTTPFTGDAMLHGQSLKRMTDRARAQVLGVLSQSSDVQAAFTVEQIVAMGRYSHRLGVFGADEHDLTERVHEALRLTGMLDLRRQSMLTLSGGERQRAFLAQVLCQDPQVLLLDEPANHLDLIYQKQIFELIDQWRQNGSRTVISVVHDLSLARRFGTHALLLDEGHCVAAGPIRDVLTDEHMNRVWRMDVRAWRRQLDEAWDE